MDEILVLVNCCRTATQQVWVCPNPVSCLRKIVPCQRDAIFPEKQESDDPE
jgi:hypothetical protein